MESFNLEAQKTVRGVVIDELVHPLRYGDPEIQVGGPPSSHRSASVDNPLIGLLRVHPILLHNARGGTVVGRGGHSAGRNDLDVSQPLHVTGELFQYFCTSVVLSS